MRRICVLRFKLSITLRALFCGIIEDEPNESGFSNKRRLIPATVATNTTTVTAEFGPVDRCADCMNRRMEIKDNAGRYERIGQRRPFNAICDGPFAHILISDWSSVLSNIMKKYLLIFHSPRKHSGFRWAAEGNEITKYIEHQIWRVMFWWNFMMKYDWLRSNRNVRSHVFACSSQIAHRAHGEKCIFALLSPCFLPPISKCLFKFYGSYLSQLSVMFSGLWPRNIPYWARDEPPRPGIKLNSGACKRGRGLHEWGEEKSKWVYGTFTIRLTHVEEARRRGMRGTKLTFTRCSGREGEPWIRFANRKRPLLYLPLPCRCSLRRSALPVPRSCARNLSSFVLVTRQSRVSGNYRKGNEIKFL